VVRARRRSWRPWVASTTKCGGAGQKHLCVLRGVEFDASCIVDSRCRVDTRAHFTSIDPSGKEKPGEFGDVAIQLCKFECTVDVLKAFKTMSLASHDALLLAHWIDECHHPPCELFLSDCSITEVGSNPNPIQIQTKTYVRTSPALLTTRTTVKALSVANKPGKCARTLCVASRPTHPKASMQMPSPPTARSTLISAV
jgi:hypothetical protein